MQDDAFAALYEPAGHSVHTVPAAYLPAAQATQSPLLFGTSPALQPLPGLGLGLLPEQDDCPVPELPGQSSHEAWPLPGAYLPASHAMQVDELVAAVLLEYFPLSHSVHCSEA